MFCTECGADGADGKFCANCGTPTNNQNASHAVAVSNSRLFGDPTSASQIVIDLCEPAWSAGYRDLKKLTPAHFDAFTSGDWRSFTHYLQKTAAYPFEKKYFKDFIEVGMAEADKAQHLDFSESLDEIVVEYINQLNPAKDQFKLLLAAGFLAKLPYPAWRGSGFWPESAVNIEREIELITEILKLGEPDSLTRVNRNEILNILPNLSDFGVSTVIPHLGESPKQRKYLRDNFRPIDGFSCISMASLLYFNTNDGKTEDLSRTVFSPRLIHLLFDDNNTVLPWWEELALWDTGGLSSYWKEYLPESMTSIEDWGEERIATLLRNSLNSDLYASKEIYEIFMQDRDVFEGFLNFLES